MVTLSGKIVCDCKGNFAGKYCNIGKYNNPLLGREFVVFISVGLASVLYSAFADISYSNRRVTQNK